MAGPGSAKPPSAGGLDKTVADAANTDIATDETMAPSDLDLGTDETLAPDDVAATGVATRPLVRSSRRTLSRGDELGRYVVLSLLGAGGMGEVYSAYDPELDRKIALKVIRERDGGHMATAAQARLLAEAQALARLSHPNVVTVYDVGTVDDGDVYIAMEFIEGVTLSTWMTADERSWQETVVLLASAARGLAAAHDAGLVHRDFKPDNVVLGGDGRVRVIDFGVALQEEKGAVEHGRGVSTKTSGGLVGTPAYMAPEQFEGDDVGPGADQFSFGITLYQALERELPFAGDTLLSLAESVCSGEARSFSKDSQAPRWLQELVMRSLSREPAQRFPSMAALIDELVPKKKTSRWGIAAAVGVTMVVGVGVGAFFLGGGEDTKCQGFETQLAEVWSSGRQQKAAAALGQEVFERISPVVDEFGSRWVRSKEAACKATHETGEQSAEVLAKRMSCLDTGLRALDAVTVVLAAGGGNPAESVGSLPSLSRCDNIAALERGDPPPRDADAAVVQEIRELLAKARALRAAGDYDRGMQAQKRAHEIAEKIGWQGAVAESLVVRGMLEAKLGKPREARETLFEAIRRASAAEDALIETQAWIELSAVEMGGMHEPKEALRWAEHAEVALGRAGGEQSLKARLASVRGGAYRLLKEYEASLRELEQAKALFEHSLGKGHYRVAATRGYMGSALRKLGRIDEAERELRAAVERQSQLFGPESPTLVNGLNNLALLLREKGQYDEARELLLRTLRIREKHLGPEHVGMATGLINLALLEQRAGNFDEVEKLWERSHAIRLKALGDDHSKVTWSLYWRTQYLANRGRDAEALALAEQVDLRRRAHSAGDSFDRASVLGIQCELHRRLGNYARATSFCDAAQSMYGRLPNRPGSSIFTDMYRVQLELDRGQLAAAEKRVNGARGKLEAIAGNSKFAHAYFSWVQARLAAKKGLASESKAAATRARAGFIERGAGYRYYIEQVEKLL